MNPHDPYLALNTLGLALPPVPPSVANFVGAAREGSLLFLSGQGPFVSGEGWKQGKVGVSVSVENAYEHARLVGLNLLSVIDHELGSLAKVRRVVKLFGMVNADPDFAMHPAVIDGCSDLFVAVLGPVVGPHARSAVGMGSLPGNISVEIEAIVAFDD